MSDNDGWVEHAPNFGQTWDFEKDGPVVIGRYTEARSVPVKVNGEDRENTLHTFLQDDGSTVSVWGSFMLDGKLRDLRGKVVRIEYTGKEPYGDDGSREVKTFKVFTK